MAQDPFPDFSSEPFRFTSPRGKLHALREFVLNHEGPVAKDDARRLMAAICRISIELLTGSHMSSRWELDLVEASRLLHGEVAMYDHDPEVSDGRA